MIESMPQPIQVLLFLGLVVIWVNFGIQLVRWLIAAIKDEGSM